MTGYVSGLGWPKRCRGEGDGRGLGWPDIAVVPGRLAADTPLEPSAPPSRPTGAGAAELAITPADPSAGAVPSLSTGVSVSSRSPAPAPVGSSIPAMLGASAVATLVPARADLDSGVDASVSCETAAPLAPPVGTEDTRGVVSGEAVRDDTRWADRPGASSPADPSPSAGPGTDRRHAVYPTAAPSWHDPLTPPCAEAGTDASDRNVTAAGGGPVAGPSSADAGIAEPAIAAAAQGRRGVHRDTLPRPRRTRLLTVANQKGGVGKTTSAVNLAAALALHGLNVLVIDLDPQGNASTALGIDHHSDVASVYDVLIDGKSVVDVVSPVEGIPTLWCVPATIDLAGAEIELVSLVARESRLKRALDAFLRDPWPGPGSRLDYVLIDCPPSLGLLTVNALVAADEVAIPIQCEYYALEGLGQLLRNIELVRSHLNPDLHVSTILLTMYDARTRLAAQVADDVRTHFPGTVLRTTIPRSVRISEAPSYGQTVMTYDPGSSGALSYLEAARELAAQAPETFPEENA